MSPKISKTEAQWREKLDAEQFRVTRMKGTERPFSGEYWNETRTGDYRCRCCGAALFHSASKFDAGCGWPSFHTAAAPENVGEHRDISHGMIRTEVVCQQCDAHLGHVFEDGPAPTGLRYCINSASIKLSND